jgi:ATP-binding cassette, subfamily A (ABC1), member 3
MDQIFPIFVVIVYTLPYMYLIQKAVEEKQTKTRESMRMMGMKDSSYFASWLIVFFFQITIISLIMTLGTYFTVFKKANIGMIFFMFWMYGMSTFGIGLIMIAIFSTVRTASLGGIVLKLVFYYIRYAFKSNTAQIWRIIASIMPQLNLFCVSAPMWQLQTFDSISFKNMTFMYNNYSFGWFYIMTIFGFFFWTLIGLYITYTAPTEFGTRRHPCFCLIPKRRNRHRVGGENQALLIQSNSDESDPESPSKRDHFERIGNELRELENKDQCLKIKSLSKVYPNGFRAVDDLSLTMYSGQIFALLGHNGAGKTTTISVLTGLFPASSGYAEAFGIDLLNDQDEARKMMGV